MTVTNSPNHNSDSTYTYTSSELLEMLRTCEDRHGTCTTRVFQADDDFCAPSTVIDRFGSWDDARVQAGLEPTDSTANRTYSNDELIEMLQACKSQHGECSPRVFDADDSFCSVSAVMRRFGSWSEAKQNAGIDEDLSSNSGRPQKYSKTQILSHLRECANRNGRTTTQTLASEDDLVAPSVVIERFESWSDAKEQAGLEPDARKNNARPREYTDEDYLELLTECAEKYGRATQVLFDQDDSFPSAGAVRRRFESWRDAKEQAGLTVGKERKYTDEELLEMLRTCKQRHGSCSAKTFADDDDFCSPETVQRAFGSWSNAKDEAGVNEDDT
jgi:transposase